MPCETRFCRQLSASGDVAAIHRRFAKHHKDILRQRAGRALTDWQTALCLFFARVEKTGLNWFLYGSGTLAVRGIDIMPGDLDFWVDDADLAGRIFEDLLIEPVTTMTGWIADKGGRAYSGCIVEWLSGVHPTSEPHEQNPACHPYEKHAHWQGFAIPVAPLDLQLAVLERRGLTERVNRVCRFMARKACE